MDIENKYGALERQKYYLPLIRDFHYYCVKNQINYSLAYGTLIGAVRHKGFIPWDDDVDIMMTRPDYERFIKCFANEPMKGYGLIGKLWLKKLTLNTNPLISTEGQCIDLFVLDFLPKIRFEAKLKILMLRFIQGMMKEKPDYSSYSFFARILVIVTRLCGLVFSKEYKQKLYNKISQWGGIYGKGDRISVTNTIFSYMNQSFSKNIISKYIYLNFEGISLMSIIGYDEYLTEIYGDYMVLPPEHSRKPKHM